MRHLVMRCVVILAVTLAVMAPEVSRADLTVQGRVVGDSGDPIPDATIEANWVGSPHRREFARTVADGSFLVRFSSSELAGAPRIQMFVGASGHRTRRIDVLTTRKARGLEVLLVSNAQASRVEEFDRLGFNKRVRAAGEHAIFLGNFKVYSDPDDADCCRATPCASRGWDREGSECVCPRDRNIELQCELRSEIKWGIRARLTQVSDVELSILAIRPGFMDDEARLRALGLYLSALGIVQGSGFVQEDADGELLLLDSEFLVPSRRARDLTIPRRVKRIGDQIPRGKRGVASDAESHLQDEWAHMALLAIAEHDIRTSQSREDLSRVLDFLRGAKSKTQKEGLRNELQIVIDRVADRLLERDEP